MKEISRFQWQGISMQDKETYQHYTEADDHPKQSRTISIICNMEIESPYLSPPRPMHVQQCRVSMWNHKHYQ